MLRVSLPGFGVEVGMSVPNHCYGDGTECGFWFLLQESCVLQHQLVLSLEHCSNVHISIFPCQSRVEVGTVSLLRPSSDGSGV